MIERRRDRDEWEPCPQGELQRMVGRIEAERGTARQTALIRVAAGIAAVCSLGVAVIWALLPPATAGGITCAECEAAFDALHRQVDLGEKTLAPERMAALLGHLRQCEYCRQEFRELYPQSNVLLRVGKLMPDLAAKRFVAVGNKNTGRGVYAGRDT